MPIFEDKCPAAMRQLIVALAVNDFQAAGIMGNAGWESAGLTTLEQVGGPAIGWFQWEGSRKTAFLAFAKSHEWDWRSDTANLEFCIHELQTSEARALALLKATTTLKEATDCFETYFERAGKPALSGRELYALRAMAAWNGPTSPAPVPTPAPDPAPAVPTPIAPPDFVSQLEAVWAELAAFLKGVL